MRTTRLAMVLACGALLVLGGCRDRSTPQDKQDTLCVELAKLDASVTKLASVAASAGNPSQVQQLRAAMEAQYLKVKEAAKDVTAFRLDSIDTAYQNVLKSSNGVNSPASLAAAQPTIDAAASAFAAARLDLHSTAGC